MFLGSFKKFKYLTSKKFSKTKKNEINEYRSLITFLNKKLQTSENELVRYINKFLMNEEKWKIINAFIKKINSTVSLNPIFELITNDVAQLIKIDSIALVLYDPKEKKLVVSSHHKNVNNPRNFEYLNEFIEAKNSGIKAKFNKKNSFTKKELLGFLKENIKTNFHIELLKTQEDFLGVLFLHRENSPLTSEEINIIEIIAENTAMAMQKATLYSKLKESDKYKREFIASMSHEFKTPLNAIIGFSEMLKLNANLDSVYKKYVDNILLSSQHLLKLMEDVIDITKAESGKIELMYEKFNTKHTIQEALGVLGNMINAKEHTVRTNLVDISISADLKRFRQLIYNLVTNAIKFTNKNGLITIITYIEDECFYFEIEDTGEGISEKDSPKIFQFFSQANSNYLKRKEGSGIGLALCKKIVEAHGGKIGFTTKEKIGSKFWFSLPV